ncbi:16S rRNA (uracil(1498)-N(3))-methyltransferase [Buchnera aphidicola]|uniref:Ribosomal RNA small subunit methyltransferase E n=1 Tax=Buchnera aphidicola subsp. Uroleucon sonchi TaxID=118118 RepID=A0A6C1FHH4_BUCUN|nr:16S rRNA (uracil(1498)-N(3))-methyltransferase [Buchnera aphidicola]QIE02105.1 16S rRNA (uracil(1498)-N(3))-methyltransferase [Buchnera aphidicola (Uroleucon sonchi)]
MKIKNYIPRIYMKENLNVNQMYILSRDNMHYLKKVLRINNENTLEIFNNTNYIFFAKMIHISHKIVHIKIFSKKLKNLESPIHIHLGQVISKNDKKMDFTIQKAIEMGVNIITPLLSETYYLKNKNLNITHKIQRWKKIAISTCQQCKRNIIPEIRYPINIHSWCQEPNNHTKIIFHPKSSMTIHELDNPMKYIRIIIGSEKGFLQNEIQKIIQYGFTAIRLGPRILRTETAALVAITALQVKFGDLK